MQVYGRLVDSGFTHNGRKNRRVTVCPAVGVDCAPPIIAGQPDTIWTTWAGPLPKPDDKQGWERLYGGTLLPLDEGA